jgi:tetratricopeptide (TPR) repeat protein/pimeloyl-ACP methyl ester carboxylesterase
MPSLKNIHEPEIPGPFSIIFVHGLGGDPETTWMSRPADHTTLWPRWVGEESGCDTWVLGYDAALSGWRDAAMSLPEQGVSVLDRLSGHKALRERPLILVGHSMGGLVIKTAIVQAMTHDVERHAEVARQVRGVVFLATPHQGSDLANLATAFRGLLRTNVQVGDLTANNAHLLGLNRQFRKLYGELGLRARSFSETRGVELGRRFFRLFRGPSVMVVPAASSDPNMPGEESIPIAADHFSICKPAMRQGDQVHDSLLAFIEDLASRPVAQDRAAAAGPAGPSTLGPVETMPPVSAAPAAPVRPGRLTGAKDARLRPREGEVLGRVDEVAAVLAFLRSNDDSAVVFAHVTGCGGIGKTEVCKAALKAWLDACPEQTAFYVDVPDESKPADLPGLIGRALGVNDVMDPQQLAQLLVPGLYYLDNLESVAEQEEGIRLLDALQKIPDVRLLASSRVDLTGMMSRRIAIDALLPDAALALFRKLWTGDVQPPDAALRQFVSQDLGCHPLSVTLIARLGNTYPFVDLVARWRSVGVVLADGHLIDSRLGSLPISLRLTKDTLQAQPGALQLWMLAALFPDGIESERVSAFEQAGHWPDAARQALTRHHIWKLRGARFHLLPPVARFALDGFASEQAAAWWSEVRLLAFQHFNQLAERADSIASNDENLRARAQLLGEFEALHRMVFQELRVGTPGDGVLETLLWNLDNTLQFRILSAAEILRASLPYMKRPASTLVRLADQEMRLGKPEESRALRERALKTYEREGNALGMANTLHSQGNLERFLTRFDEARKLYLRALSLFAQVEDQQGQANTYRALGNLERVLGHVDDARKQFERALSLYEEQRDDQGQASVLQVMGIMEISRDMDKARALLERALPMFIREQDWQGEANTHQSLGDLEQVAGHPREALGLYRLALDLYASGGDLMGEANVWAEMARCHAMLDEDREKHAALERAWRAAEASNIESARRYVSRVATQLDGE